MTVSRIVLGGLRKAAQVLKKAKVNYCLFGGLALQVYRRIRATKDIDLAVSLSPSELKDFIGKMEGGGFRWDRSKGIIKISELQMLRFVYEDKDTGFEIFIDIVTTQAEFQKQVLARKSTADFLGIKIPVASLEDLVLLKLLSGRPIDDADAQALMQENRKIVDKIYLETWAKKLNLSDKLEKLLLS